MEFITHIIKLNFLIKEDKIYIKSSYLSLFVNCNALTQQPIQHNGKSYFELNSLPLEVIESTALPEEMLIYQELYLVYPSATNPYVSRYLKSLKINLEHIINDPSPFIGTYSDYKLDSDIVKRKALTHGVMYYISPFLTKFPDRYESIFNILVELSPEVELPLSSLRKFCSRVDEIIRAGLPFALTRDIKPPLENST